MKILMAILVLTLCSLVFPGMAELHRVPLGPYSVSFDLGYPKTSYWVDATDLPQTEESLSGDVTTKYDFTLTSKLNTSQHIDIWLILHSTYQAIPSSSELASFMGLSLLDKTIPEGYLYDDSDMASRTIDGREGGIAYMKIRDSKNSADTKVMYLAGYFLTPRLTVGIQSSYPWDEGTLQLLKTIHVEKANATSPQSWKYV